MEFALTQIWQHKRYLANSLILIFLMGCGQVPVKDEVIYANKGMGGGVSFHLLTKDQKDIAFADWMKILRNNPLICTSVTAFGDIKIEIEQLCSICGCCSADMTKAIDQFVTNVTSSTKK